MKVTTYLTFLCLVISVTAAMGSEFKEPAPRTPNAASLGKYGDIPVSYHTGVPNISIPIYTVQQGDLSLPISFSYHSSGIKVDEVASWVGLGWALNAGGVITRSVMSSPDEGLFNPTNSNSDESGWGWYKDYGLLDHIVNPFLSDPTWGSPNSDNQPGIIDEQNNRNYFLDAANGLLDTEPDMYSFNFQGYSGKFVFDENRNVNTIPWEDVHIEPLNDDLDEWRITAPDGTKYYFGGSNASEKNYTSTGLSYFQEFNQSTSYYLYRIESVNGQDWIKISYDTEEYIFCNRMSHTVVRSYGGWSCTYLSGDLDDAPHGRLINSVLGKRISKIETSSGNVVVDFLATHTRQDLNAKGNQNATNTQAKGLTAIKISGANGLCKEFTLNLSYFQSSTTSSVPNFSSTADAKRLKLNSIQEKSCDGTVTKNPYVFTYNSSTMARRYSLGRDHWGYYNGYDSNRGLIPNGITVVCNGQQQTVNGGATRIVSLSRSLSWMLEKITYPTKGYTQFEYENHKDNYNQAIGGLRVKKITNSANEGSPVIERTFTYSEPQLYTANPNSNLNGFYVDNPYNNQDIGSRYYQHEFGSIIRSTPPTPQYTTQGYHIGYRLVTEHFPNGDKIEYVYSDISGSYYTGFPKLPSQTPYGKGQLISEEKKNTGGKTIAASTSQFANSAYSTDIVAKKVVAIHDYLSGVDFVAVSSYNLNSVRGQLSRKSQTIDGVTTTTIFTYDPNNKHGNAIKTTVTNSKGQTVETEFLYPSDAGSGAPVQMYDKNNANYKNMLGIVIDQKTKVDGTETSRSHSYYTYNGTDDMIHLTSSRLYPTGGSTYKEMFYNYDKYDRLESVERQDDISSSYLWAYNNALPVAKINNAKLVQTEQTVSTTKSFSATTSSSVTDKTFVDDFTLDTDQTIQIDYTYNCSFNSCQVGDSYHYADLHIENESGQTVSNSSVHLWQAGTITKSHSLTAGTYTVYYTARLTRPPACDQYIPLYMNIPIAVDYTYQEKESNIVYESFEEDPLANTSYAKTGRKSKYGAYTMQISTEPGTYILSYWKKSNSSSPWQYYEVELTNPTSYTLSSSGQYVDEVRFYPKGAQMQSYTHDPGFGSTSETDPNGKSITYEYDKLGRLITVRDNEGNILNHTKYIYQQ